MSKTKKRSRYISTKRLLSLFSMKAERVVEMDKKIERNEAASCLTYVRYFDDAYGYEGVGVLSEENKDVFRVTSVIGAVFLCEQTSYRLTDLPSYTMFQRVSDYTLQESIVVPDWVRAFSVDEMTPTDIHHCGLFFETFLLDKRPLQLRLEETMKQSLLEGNVRASVLRHILNHYREAGEDTLLACAVSPVIQSALHES